APARLQCLRRQRHRGPGAGFARGKGTRRDRARGRRAAAARCIPGTRQPAADTASRSRRATGSGLAGIAGTAFRGAVAAEPRQVKPARLLAALAVVLLPAVADAAAPGIPAVVVQGEPGGQSYSLTLQLLI